MEMIVQPHGQDSGVRPVEQLGFDMLRSLFAARQSSTATVRALVSAHHQITPAEPAADENPTLASLMVLTGRRPAEAPQMGGAFASHSGADQAVASQGESHG